MQGDRVPVAQPVADVRGQRPAEPREVSGYFAAVVFDLPSEGEYFPRLAS